MAAAGLSKRGDLRSVELIAGGRSHLTYRIDIAVAGLDGEGFDRNGRPSPC